jgi:hypothetical protein
MKPSLSGFQKGGEALSGCWVAIVAGMRRSLK